VKDYEGKNFKSVTKGDIKLADIEEKSDAAPKQKADEGELKDLIAALREILSEDVGDVRTTNRLTDSPVCLVAGDNEVDLRMERVLRIHQNYKNAGKRVLEINPSHALIVRLAALAKGHGDEILKDAGHLLLDQARIIQGEPIPDPTGFARRMGLFMERGLAV
jgi:molecular chaperone HtpG